MQETPFESVVWEVPLEKEMAPHSSVLAWKKTPWTEKPGELQSMGLQSVGHDLVTKQQRPLLASFFILPPHPTTASYSCLAL